MTYWRDKSALVTGGSSGLGAALALELARRGARVAVAARDQQRLNEISRRIAAVGGPAVAVASDVTSDHDVQRLMELVQQRLGGLDLLVNAAGASDRGLACETSPERFRELLELNLLGTVRCSQAAAPLLRQSRGHLVNVGSLASKTASRHLGAYPASKFAVAAFTQQLRFELGPEGVHVLLVCPGPIRRDDAGSRYDERAEGLPEEARRPGGGAKLRAIDPQWLSDRILKACRRRQAELVVPGSARWLFAISQLWPSLGDWILRRKGG